jgi:hypothetical protein
VLNRSDLNSVLWPQSYKENRYTINDSVFVLKCTRKITYKKLGAHQSEDFKLEQCRRRQNRLFSMSYFDKKN